MKGAFYSGNKQFRIMEPETYKLNHQDVRIKVDYAGICGTDIHIYLGHMDKLVKTPQVIGHEMSGEIVELGESVSNFQVGEKVAVRPLAPCMKCPSCEKEHYNCCPNLNFLGVDSPGCFQTYWVVPSYTLCKLAPKTNMATAALIEPIAVALHGIRFGSVERGDYALIQGAGPIGLLVALLCRHNKARVLISEVNDFRINLAKELGFEVVNPREVNIPEYVNQQTSNAGADIVFEVSGSPEGASLMTKLVRTRGKIVLVAIYSEPTKVDLRQIFVREIRLIGVRNYDRQDFDNAIELVASGKLPFDKLITEIRPIEQIQNTFQEIERGANFMKVLFSLKD